MIIVGLIGAKSGGFGAYVLCYFTSRALADSCVLMQLNVVLISIYDIFSYWLSQ